MREWLGGHLSASHGQPTTATEQKNPGTPSSSSTHCLLLASGRSIWDGSAKPWQQQNLSHQQQPLPSSTARAAPPSCATGAQELGSHFTHAGNSTDAGQHITSSGLVLLGGGTHQAKFCPPPGGVAQVSLAQGGHDANPTLQLANGAGAACQAVAKGSLRCCRAHLQSRKPHASLKEAAKQEAAMQQSCHRKAQQGRGV